MPDCHLSKCLIWEYALILEFQVAFQGIPNRKVRELITYYLVLDLGKNVNKQTSFVLLNDFINYLLILNKCIQDLNDGLPFEIEINVCLNDKEIERKHDLNNKDTCCRGRDELMEVLQDVTDRVVNDIYFFEGP